jgi:hypothetical protein
MYRNDSEWERAYEFDILLNEAPRVSAAPNYCATLLFLGLRRHRLSTNKKKGVNRCK